MSRADYEIVVQHYSNVVKNKNLTILSPLKLKDYMVVADTVFRYIPEDKEKNLPRVFTATKSFAIEGGPQAVAPGGDVNYFLQGTILASVGVRWDASENVISSVIIAWNLKQSFEKHSLNDVNQIGHVIPWAQQGFDYDYDNVRGGK